MIRRFFALILGLAVFINLAWAKSAAGAVDYSIIRIMLSSMGTPDRVSLRVEGQYSIPQIGDGLINKGSYEICVEDGRLILRHDSTSRVLGSRFVFKSENPSFSNYLRILNNSYGWTNYLGDMEVRLENGGIRLINHVFLEYYLYGVVPYEMSNSWPIEALKAQAIAARTYAVRCRNPYSYFDLYDTENSQVYRGYDPSKKNAIQAVNETYGMVLKYDNSFASTYYSSSNGGRIESSGNLWGEYLPYLIVQDDPFDVSNPANPNATWIVEYSKLSVEPAFQARIKARMQSYLESMGYSGNEGDINILQIKELSFDPPNDSGRMEKGRLVVVADVKSKAGDTIHTMEYTISLTKTNIRNILNLKSLLFTVEETENSYILQGGGYGHGVGMSQFGAHFMALQGLTFAHILGFYYPGTRIETLRLTPPESRGDDRPELPEQPEEPEKPEEPEEPAQPQEPEKPAENKAVYGKVNVTTSLNVRQGPGLQYEKIGSLSSGTRIQILEQGVEWHKIKAGNLQGYVSSQYIIIENEEQKEPQEPGQGQSPVKPEDPAPPSDKKRYAIVTASALNIRSGPSTRNHKVGMVVRGTRLRVLEQSELWYKIEVNGLVGYVHGDYIKLEDGDANPAPQPSTPPAQVAGKARVAASSLNMRSGAGMEHAIIGSLPNGTEIELLEKHGIWYKIKFGAKTGFVHGGYLNIIQDIGSSGTPSAKTGTVNASALNVRTGPGLNYPKTALLYQGAKITILKEVNGWYQIQHGSTTGYVSAEYVKL